MFRIMSLNKYQALTRYVIELEEKCKVLKEFNANMEREIKRLEEKIKDYESNGVKIKAEEDFYEYEPMEELDLELEIAANVFNDDVTGSVVTDV